MTRRLIIAAAVAGLLGAATPAAAAGGPVFRDGLEKRLADSRFERILTNGQIGPWQVTRGDVDLANTVQWQVTEGEQNLDLDGGRPGAVATTIRTLPGKTYRVTYQLAGNPSDPRATARAVKTGELRADGKLVQTFAFDTTGKTYANMGFVTKSATVVSSGTSLRLEFASTMPRTAGGWGPVIDDVRVDSAS